MRLRLGTQKRLHHLLNSGSFVGSDFSAMSDLFASPKITLAWAKRHLYNFNTILSQIATDNDGRYVIEPNPDGVTEAHKVKLADEFNDLTCIIFDFTNNLRSVLDQTAFQVARLHTGRDDPKYASFPFCSDASTLAAKVKGVCKDLPTEIRSLFETFKPYKAGNPALWAINEIANSAKHFELVAAIVDPNFVRLHTHVGGKSAAFVSSWDDEKKELKIFNARLGFQRQSNVTISLKIRLNHVAPEISHRLAAPFLNTMPGIVESILLSTEAECRRLGLN
jgi:hypothetical protein